MTESTVETSTEVSLDITEKAEEALRTNEEKYRIIFENARDMIIHLDKYGRVVSANKMFMDTLGWEPDELVGKHFTKLGLLRLRDIPRITKLWFNVLRTGKAQGLLELQLKDIKCNVFFAEASNQVIKMAKCKECCA